MTGELISVIVPAYNSEQWLTNCLESILNQTYHNLEIIVINDGSTDNTQEIIQRFAKKDKRIKPINQENKGLVLTREVGINNATGDYIGFVDSDDIIENDMYERLIRNAISYQADISHCGVKFVYPNGNSEEHYGTEKIVEQDNVTGVKNLLECGFIEPSLCNKIYKSELLINSCLDFTVLNNEDLLRNFVLFSRSQKSVYEDFCGYIYFQREGSMSKDRKKVIQSSRHILKARKIILDNSNSQNYPYAMQLWLSTYVNVFTQMNGFHDAEIKQFCCECRNTLKHEIKNFKYLIKRQEISAYLIVFSPFAQKVIYKLYAKIKK